MMKKLQQKVILSAESKIYKWSKKYGKKIGLDLPYFIKNGFWVTVRQGIGVIGGVASSIVFARMATQEVFGQYQLIVATLAAVAILAIPGLNIALTRSVVRGCDGDYKRVVKTSFVWSLLGIPVLLGIGGYYYVYQDRTVGIVFMISSMFFPFMYAPSIWNSFLQAKCRFDISAKYGSIQVILNTVVMVIIVFFNKDNLIPIIGGYLILYTGFNGYFFWKSLQYIENKKKEEGIIRYGWFLTSINVFGVIANNVDKLIVGIFFSPAHLAVYTIGILIPSQLQGLVKSFLQIVIPKQIKQGGITVANYLVFFLIGMVSALGVWVILPIIIPLVYSEKYSEAVSFARIIIIFFPFFIIAALYKRDFVYKKDTKRIAIESVITPLIKIIAMAVFIPIFGMHFLAFLFGFQYVIMLVVLYILSKVKFSFRLQGRKL